MNFGGRCDIGDDEVVASYGVYFSPALAGNTHILQYPLREQNRPYEADEVKMFYTPGNTSAVDNSSADTSKKGAVLTPASRLAMRCTLDTFGSPNILRDRQRSMGDSAGGAHKYRYTLHSEPFVPKSDYCVAQFTGNEVHLTPVSTVQRLYPAHNTETKGAAEEDNFSWEDEASVTGPLRVPPQHTSANTGPVVSGMSMSDRNQRELQRQRSATINKDADSAKQLQFFSLRTNESKAMRRHLIVTTKEPAAGLSGQCGGSGGVENSLFPPEILSSGGITGGDDRTSQIIRSYAFRWSVADQVSQLMLRCQVLPFSLIAGGVSKGAASSPATSVSSGEILEALRPRAVYMHGVWVCRISEQFKGAAAALREVVLLLFSQSPDGTLQRSQLNQMVVSSALRRTIKDILETVAILNSDEPYPTKRRWRLRYVPENANEYKKSVEQFSAEFASDEATQRAAWEKRSQAIMGHLAYINASRTPPRLLLETAQSNYGAAGVGQGGNAGSPMSPVGSRGPSAGAGSAEIRDQDLAPIRRYIRMVFAEHGVINKMRAKELVLKGRESHYPKATNSMLSTALQSSVQAFTEATWVLKTLGEPTVDRYRPLILQVILELRRFEVAALQRRLDEVMTERGEHAPGDDAGPDARAIPDAVLRRVVKEVCDFQAGERLWSVKSGNIIMDQ